MSKHGPIKKVRWRRSRVGRGAWEAVPEKMRLEQSPECTEKPTCEIWAGASTGEHRKPAGGVRSACLRVSREDDEAGADRWEG